MTCCPNQVGHEPSAATNRINIFWDRTLFYTAPCTKIKFFMILEVLEAKGTFLQWKTTSGHRRKWKCEDIYLSLILAFFWPMPNSDRPISWAPPTSSSQQTRVHLVVHQPPSPPSKTSWECWCLSFPPPPSPDHPLKVHGGLASLSSPR